MRRVGEFLLKGLEVTAILIMPLMLIAFLFGGFVYILYVDLGWVGGLIGVGVVALAVAFALWMGPAPGNE